MITSGTIETSTPGKSAPQSSFRSLLRWLALAPVVFLTLLCVGQMAILLRPPTGPVDVHSALMADYRAWPLITVEINVTVLVEEIRKPVGNETPLPMFTVTEGNFWFTPTPVGAATLTPTVTQTPLPPTITLTPTPSVTATRPTGTITSTPTQTLTATPTQTPTRPPLPPSLTPTRTFIPTFTRTVTLTPTTTLTPITLTPTVTLTRSTMLDTTLAIASRQPNPSVVGQPVTVTVNLSHPTGPNPTGVILIEEAGGGSCTATLPATSCRLGFTSTGAKTITARYSGDTVYRPSSAPAVNHPVNRAGTTVTIHTHQPDPSVVGRAVTVAFRVSSNIPGAGTPTGSVTVSSGTASCTATVAEGQCDLVLTTLGNHALSATYRGSANFNTSTSQPANHRVIGETGLTLNSVQPSPSVTGQEVSVSFTLSVIGPTTTPPTGTVTITGRAGETCAANLPATSCRLVFATAGNRQLTAVYSGDTLYGTSTAQALSHTVRRADTVLTIQSHQPEPSGTGQDVTVRFNLSVAAPGAGTPTGTVTISDNETDECTVRLPATSCRLNFPTTGIHTLTATYTGDSNFNAASASPVTHQVIQYSQTTINFHRPSPSLSGQAVSIGFSVSTIGPSRPTGTVTVTAGSESCTATLPATSCSITFPAAGSRTLVAAYSGDGNIAGSTSEPVTHVVNRAGSTLTLTTNFNPARVVGQPVTLAYQLTANNPGTGTPTGTVTISASGPANVSCSIPVTGSTGQCARAFTEPGVYSVAATYSGDANFNPSSTAGPSSLTIGRASTAITITAHTPNPSALSQPVTVAFNLAVLAPGSGQPTGTVTISDGVSACTATLPDTGCVLTLATPGSRTLTARYSGDSRLNASTSPAVNHTVGLADTTIAITSNLAAPSVAGESVTVNFSLSAVGTVPGAPTGTVRISTTGPAALECIQPAAPTGACALTFPAAGNYTVTAAYSGNTQFNPSSTTAAHPVTGNGTTLVIRSDQPDPSEVAQAVTVSFDLTVNPPGSGSPSGVVTVTSDDGRTCSATLPNRSCTLTFLTAGVKTLTASYPGSGSYAGATSPGVTHTVNPGIDLFHDVGVTKTDGVESYEPGGALIYTIRISNAGPGPASGTLTDRRPTQVSSWTWTCTRSSPADTCAGSNANPAEFVDSVTIAAGQYIEYQVNVSVLNTAADTLVNTAAYRDNTGFELNQGNNNASDSDFDASRVLIALPSRGTAAYDPATDRCVATFGYSNFTGVPLPNEGLFPGVPVTNYLTPASPPAPYTLIGSIPTTFQPGTVENAFQVTWDPSANLRVIWTLDESSADVMPCSRPP